MSIACASGQRGRKNSVPGSTLAYPLIREAQTCYCLGKAGAVTNLVDGSYHGGRGGRRGWLWRFRSGSKQIGGRGAERLRYAPAGSAAGLGVCTTAVHVCTTSTEGKVRLTRFSRDRPFHTRSKNPLPSSGSV